MDFSTLFMMRILAFDFKPRSPWESSRTRTIKPLMEMLRDNADRDPFLRHAAVLGLAGIDDFDGLLQAAHDPSSSARMGVLLAFRRLRQGDVARFLDDPDPRLAVEAARRSTTNRSPPRCPTWPRSPSARPSRAFAPTHLSANAQLGRDQDAARLAAAAADRA